MQVRDSLFHFGMFPLSRDSFLSFPILKNPIVDEHGDCHSYDQGRHNQYPISIIESEYCLEDKSNYQENYNNDNLCGFNTESEFQQWQDTVSAIQCREKGSKTHSVNQSEKNSDSIINTHPFGLFAFTRSKEIKERGDENSYGN